MAKPHYLSTITEALGEKFVVNRQLGRGTQGAAWLVKKKANREEVVAKEATGDDNEAFRLEFEKMKELQHPNICKVIELVAGRGFADGVWKEHLYVISELARGSDMHKYMKKAIDARVQLTEEWVAGIFKEAMQGVAYIHSRDIVHNDLKPDNILMADDFDPRAPDKIPGVLICDFGCATFPADKFFKTGDPRYQSAEAWLIIKELFGGNQDPFTKVGPKADVWMMAVTLFELLSGGVLPFIYRPMSLGEIDHDMWGELAEAFLGTEMQAEKYCIGASPEVIDLLNTMFVKDPTQRPSAEQVLQHQWISIQGKPVSEAITTKLRFNLTKALAHTNLQNALSTKLQSDHYEQSLSIFKSLDSGNSGHIGIDEFKEGCVSLGKDGKEAANLFREVDIDNSRQVDFNKFMASTFDWEGLTNERLYVGLFESFSGLDENAEVDFKDIYGLFRILDTQGVLRESEIEEMFHRIDTNGDKKIPKDELMAYLFHAATDEEIEKYAKVDAALDAVQTQAQPNKQTERMATTGGVICCLALLWCAICKS